MFRTKPYLLLLLAMSACCGCFRRFVKTDRQIREYYSNRTVKPVYFTIKNDSVRLFCATVGADTLPPLLLIHGAPGAWYGSRNLMDDSLLQTRFHIISVDRPGYGHSSVAGGRRSFTSIHRQAVAIYEALRLNRSNKKGIIMGSSYGGPIAARMAVEHPDRFYHVVLLAAAVDPNNEKFWWFHPLIKHGPIKWMLPRFMRHATDEKFAHVRELKELLPSWKRLSVPVTAIQGDADHIVPPVNLDFLRHLLEGKNARFISLPGADHLLRWQRFDFIRSLLTDSIQSTP